MDARMSGVRLVARARLQLLNAAVACALARSTRAVGLRRAKTNSHCELEEVVHVGELSNRSPSAAVIGSQTSTSPSSVPVNPSGATPTIVYRAVPMSSV